MKVAVVGAGIAGCTLAYLLKQHNDVQITIFDPYSKENSSSVAAGLYNPITGKQRKFTWNVEKLFPEIEPFYSNIQNLLGTKFLYPFPIMMPFVSYAEREYWTEKSTDHNVVQIEISENSPETIAAPFGAMLVQPAGYLDVSTFCQSLLVYFKRNKVEIRLEPFRHNLLQYYDNTWKYRSLEFDKVIFCEGHQVVNNPYFNHLPFAPVKGEVIELEINNLDRTFIYNKAMFLLPEGMENKFKCGSTYRHTWSDEHLPEEQGIENILQRMEKVYTGEYKLINAKAGIRPSTKDRRPILGEHPFHKNLYLFNGLGTKGVSLSPYFGKKMVDLILHDIKPELEVTINRFLNN